VLHCNLPKLVMMYYTAELRSVSAQLLHAPQKTSWDNSWQNSWSLPTKCMDEDIDNVLYAGCDWEEAPNVLPPHSSDGLPPADTITDIVAATKSMQAQHPNCPMRRCA
jgi:hypothetical protein